MKAVLVYVGVEAPPRTHDLVFLVSGGASASRNSTAYG